MTRTRTADLTAGKYAKWKSLSLHANPKASKPWAQRVTGTHEKYGVDGEWLDKSYIDDQVYFDVSGLEAGDIIKVSGGSHNKKQNGFFCVSFVGEDVIEYEKTSEADVLEALENGDGADEARELRAEIQDGLEGLDAEQLAEVSELVADLGGGI